MADFYAARRGIIPPLPWPTFAPPFSVRSIRDVTDPIRDHLAARLTTIAEDGDLTIIFVVEGDRSLSIRLRGEPLLVNQARDVLGEEEEIGPLLS